MNGYCCRSVYSLKYHNENLRSKIQSLTWRLLHTNFGGESTSFTHIQQTIITLSCTYVRHKPKPLLSFSKCMISALHSLPGILLSFFLIYGYNFYPFCYLFYFCYPLKYLNLKFHLSFTYYNGKKELTLFSIPSIYPHAYTYNTPHLYRRHADEKSSTYFSRLPAEITKQSHILWRPNPAL